MIETRVWSVFLLLISLAAPATAKDPATLITDARVFDGQSARLREGADVLIERNPYPGPIGVIQEGALADLLLIDGNPLEDLSILTKPDESLVLIMKDGHIYKNTIESRR